MTLSIVSSAGGQQTLALLQAQVAHYTPAVNDQGDEAIADYKELQTAVKTGNIAEAQVDLAQLRQSEAASSSTATSPSGPLPANTPAGESGGAGSGNASDLPPKLSIDTTA